MWLPKFPSTSRSICWRRVIGDIIHLSDITFPEGVVSVDLSLGSDHDLAIAQVKAPRGGSDDEDAAEGGEEAPAAEG